MNLEKIAEPITSKSIEEHEQSIQEKLQRIQLEYIDGIFSKRIPPAEIKYTSYEEVDGREVETIRDLRVNDFRFLLNRYTSVLRELMDSYIKKYEKSRKWDPKLYDSVEENFKDKIFEFYQKDHEHWIDKTRELIENESENIEELSAPQPDEKFKAGIISFDPDSGYTELFDIKHEGITDYDYGISIHLDPLFKTNFKETNKNLFSSHSLENLAEQIVDKYPETKAIFARSWLMDTPIAQRIGFTTYENKKVDYSTPAFWYQFITDRGQIDTKRVNSFLATGKPPYEVKIGVILAEDFLRKYLPLERRGKIVLKETIPEVREEYEKERTIINELWKNWDSKTESDIEDTIANCPLVQELLGPVDVYGLDINPGENFWSKVKALKRAGRPIDEVHNDPLLKEYVDIIRAHLKKVEYREKEVIID